MVGLGGWGLQEQEWRKGPWTVEEDKMLTEYVSVHGEGRWSTVAKAAGLKRNSKSCRLRWVNYLRPGLKRGQLTPEEETIIIELHSLWGNKWSMIARCLPGRTDNEIKNYWRTHFKNKAKPSASEEKPKVRILRRQKQQQQHKEQQQQYLLQEPVRLLDDIKGVQCGSEQCEYQVFPAEMDLMFPNVEERSFLVVGQSGASSSDAGDEGLWGGLWNMDDLHIQYNNTSQ